MKEPIDNISIYTTISYFISIWYFYWSPCFKSFHAPLSRFFRGRYSVHLNTFMYITLDYPRGGGADNFISDLSGTCLQSSVSIFGKTFGTKFKVWVKSLQQTSQKCVVFQNRSNLSWRLLCESKTVSLIFREQLSHFPNIFHNRVKEVSLGSYPLYIYIYIYCCPFLWIESCRWLLWCLNVIPLDLDLLVTHLLSSKSILTGL